MYINTGVSAILCESIYNEMDALINEAIEDFIDYKRSVDDAFFRVEIDTAWENMSYEMKEILRMHDILTIREFIAFLNGVERGMSF